MALVELGATSSTNSIGFDDPLANEAEDQLDRRKFADLVYAHLTKVKPEWSVRVGVIAPWGDGKTTVCKWIAERAKAEGHHPVWYSPWAAHSDEDIWNDFHSELKQQLIGLNPVDVQKKSVWRRCWEYIKNPKNWWDWFKNLLRHRAVSRATSDSTGIGKSLLRLARYMSRITPEEIDKIRQKVKGKRVIVILDDLDRVAPDLVPRLLMSVREIMNLEGFSFLLPFDDFMVATALTKYNSAPGFGENFLEKILDYRMNLPAPSKEQIEKFFRHEMTVLCQFVNTTDFGDAIEYLPRNPRKLKGLVRRFQVFETEAARHRADELDWGALLFAEMIRQEDETFFKLFTTDTFFSEKKQNADGTPAYTPWFAASIPDADNDQEKGKARKAEIARIRTLLNKAPVTIEGRKERLEKLCEGWRAAYGYIGSSKLIYMLKLIQEPDAMTWGEFDELWKVWETQKSIVGVTEWAKAQSVKVNKPVADIFDEALKTAIAQYGTYTNESSSVWLVVEVEDRARRAAEVLSFIEVIIQNEVVGVPHTALMSVEFFELFLTEINKWWHFRGNPSDVALRSKEEALLEKWVGQAQRAGHGPEYYKILHEEDGAVWDEEKGTGVLYDKLVALVDNSMVEQALAALTEEDGMSSLMPRGRKEGVKAKLMNVNSRVWTPHGGSEGEKILFTASKSPAIQKNARNFLDVLWGGVKGRAHEISSAKTREFYKHHSLVTCIWNAAIASPLQHRRLMETRQVREALISQGVPPEALQVPDWLLGGKKVGEKFTPPIAGATPTGNTEDDIDDAIDGDFEGDSSDEDVARGR